MRLHNLFENTTPESLIEDIIDIELTDDFAIEGRIVEFNEDGSVTIELDEQAQELVDLDEEQLNEFIPLAIGAAALGMTAYDAYKNYKAYKRGDITKSDLAKRVGTDAAIGIATGGIGKLASKAFKAGRAGVQALKRQKVANRPPADLPKTNTQPTPTKTTTRTDRPDPNAKAKSGKWGKAARRANRAGMGTFGNSDYDNPLQRAVSKFSFESYSPGDEMEDGMVSDCCGAPIMDVYDGHGRCSDCKEMASAVNESKSQGDAWYIEQDAKRMAEKDGHDWSSLPYGRKSVYRSKAAEMRQTDDDDDMYEAEYQGRKVKLGKPMAGDVKKFKVYVKNPKGNVVKVNFGQKGVKIKKNNPARRKSFRARHNCDNPGPRHKARYWSCRKW